MSTVVVGAGLSGLTVAAARLEQGTNAQLVEADTQIGDRIRAIRAPASKRPLADLGPTWV